MLEEKTIKVAFFDRDGIINYDYGYVHKIKDFHFVKGIFDVLKFLLTKNFKIIIVTNQSGIGRGMYSESDFINVNNWMLEEMKKESITILDVFFCPHGPDSTCNCRKPKPGMLFDAIRKYNISLTKSLMVGDSARDIQAAKEAGIKNNYLVNSNYKKKIDSEEVFLCSEHGDLLRLLRKNLSNNL